MERYDEAGQMKIIGITGGVGAGKSTVLEYLERRHGAYTVQADLVGHTLMEPEGSCFSPILDLLGKEILDAQGRIDRKKVAGIVFPRPEVLAKLNGIIHPAVKKEILRQAAEEEWQGRRLFVIEAALLIEDHYDAVCADMWYICADPAVRRQRLKDERGYTDEKITDIFRNQQTDQIFRQKCGYVVENNGDLRATYQQIDRRIGEYGIL